MRRLRMVSQAIPGRPRSTVRLPLRGARHSWPPWPERAPGESLRIAGLSETVRGQKPSLCGAPTRRRVLHRFAKPLREAHAR